MKFFRKYKLQFDILTILVFAFGSYMFFEEYSEAENKKMKLAGAISTCLMAVIKLIDLIDGLRMKRKKKIQNL